MENNKIEFTRINNDINGNPRYVCGFSHFVKPEEIEQSYIDSEPLKGIFAIDIQYKIALKRAKQIGGKKFHNKQYGGGIVFQSYNIKDLEKQILELINS